MSGIILTTYLTRRPDPQRHLWHPKDDDSRLASWLPGMKRLDLHGIIFHDDLSEPFMERHQTDRIRFVKVPAADGWSNNDYRFRLYRDWLRGRSEFEFIFCTDLFDVTVKGNPHALISDAFQLWAGREEETLTEHSRGGRRILQHLEHVYGRVPDGLYGKTKLNAGILGGRSQHVRRFLDLIITEIERMKPILPNANMPAFNLTMYRDIGEDNIWAQGAPLHSRFGAYDHTADVCFVHY